MTLLMKAKQPADSIYEGILEKVAGWKCRGILPRLDIILVEGDAASSYYAQAKQKIAGKLGIHYELHSFPSDVKQSELLQVIQQLNEDDAVHGIMLELPLPDSIETATIVQAIDSLKDIDGVTPQNKLAVVTGAQGLYPATPQACIKLVQHYGYALQGKNVTLVGRGQTVGLPLFHMLQRENATVTLCHSRTEDIAFHLAHADVVFVAVGKANMITKSMVKPHHVIVDAGINELEDGRIAGDVAADVGELVSAISPVPGGVGTVTTSILFQNLMLALELQREESVR